MGVLSPLLYPGYKQLDGGLAVICWLDEAHILGGKRVGQIPSPYGIGGETGYIVPLIVTAWGREGQLRSGFSVSAFQDPPWFYLLFHPWITTIDSYIFHKWKSIKIINCDGFSVTSSNVSLLHVFPSKKKKKEESYKTCLLPCLFGAVSQLSERLSLRLFSKWPLNKTETHCSHTVHVFYLTQPISILKFIHSYSKAGSCVYYEERVPI